MPWSIAGLIIVLLFSLPSTSVAQRVAGRFSTSVYTFERFDTVNSSRIIARAYQSMQLTVSEGSISFNSSLYGVTNISQSFGNDAAIRVSNLFLEWKDSAGSADVRIGRFPVFAGVGNGSVDGASVKFNHSGITILGYGGENVRPDLRSTGFADLNENFFLGGQIIAALPEDIRVSLSYANRHIQRDEYSALRSDSLFNPVVLQIVPDSRADQAFGVDTRYDGEALKVHGRYDYDLNFKRSRRGELGGRMTANEHVTFTGDFVYREPLIPFNSMFGFFPVSSIREYEGGIEYTPFPDFFTYGRFAFVDYRDDRSRRISLGMYFNYGSLGFSGTDGYAGQLSSIDGQAAYPFLDRRLIPTLGFSFSAYRLDESSPREDIFAGTLGAVVRPFQWLSGDFQIQWLRNKVMDHDVRLYAKLNYWFSRDLKLFDREEAHE